MEKTENQDRTLEAFRKHVPYMRGALWWCANDLLKERNSAFCQNDGHKGHPLLSLRKEEVMARGDGVPMLVGTSGDAMSGGRKRRCVEIVGMTKDDPDHRTYFGSIIEPGMYSVAELIDGVSPKKGEHVFEVRKELGHSRSKEKARLREPPRFAYRTMFPNWDKPMANDNEMRSIDRFCLDHRL
jgi:hypothetical protein